jgi:hypothetical protein
VALHSETLTPQMTDYLELVDRGEWNYLPYLMYYNRTNFRSASVNTDQFGFRVSHGPDNRASAGDHLLDEPVRLIVGGSVAFSYGVKNDAASLASRLWTKHAPSRPWLTFAGHCYNATQELMLYLLYRHLIPPVEEVVIFSGYNTLAMSRLTDLHLGGQGPFFYCVEYFEKMRELRERNAKPVKEQRWRARAKARTVPPTTEAPTLPELIDSAVAETLRHLDSWQALAAAIGARVTWVMQPLAPWLRDEPAAQEKLLFDESDQLAEFGTWQELYGDISTVDFADDYAAAMGAACERAGVNFLDMISLLRAATSSADWLYVDRAHFTDEGVDIVAGLLADNLELS